MNLSIAIDAYNLTCYPFTSNAVYVEELARSFSKNDKISSIYLVIPSIPDLNFKYHSLGNENKIKFIFPSEPFNPNKNWLFQTIWMQIKVLKCLQKLQKVDILISPYHQVPVMLSKRIKSVVVIHDICGLDTKLYPVIKKGFYKHYYNFITALWRADTFISISKFTKEQFERKFPSTKHKLSPVVYNNITSQLIGEEIMKNVLAKYSLNNLSYFLVIGAMSSRKGLDLIIEAWKIYQSNQGNKTLFMVVGINQVEYIEDLLWKNSIQNFNVITRITSEERDSLYRGAAALLFPSRCEGFGFPILEAMTQGCPPIAWSNSPAKEIIKDDKLLLRTLDPVEICEFIFKYDNITTTDREELAAKLMKSSKNFMNNDFGSKFFDAMMHKLEAV